ncbi:hypothetical protein [Lactococcus petauri]|uniref:Uncharacterized protein n=1 Tax=Lactococcus petauri TaxID=1940789 RepID=A0AAJ2ITY1_9LACT|nr:hypothetical protein [Lactococcus petauri]MDT2526056.1 hypothetical protein [Lactococcus petauri]MDT2540601.1 hypothetical protein [Lactococcus petauri]MDT2557176.1 hypothetical protein [Lactococcus petauri]MDT2559750.1 hypothetical protein [Lactococcus petauri]MDT2568323.1 hypothetical protein [Lactococcus petauri]
MELKKGEGISVSLKELVEEYGELLTESSKKSVIRNNYRLKDKTKHSVEAQLREQFESVRVISTRGRYGGTSFVLQGFNGLNDYNAHKNNSRPSIDWENERNVISKLINEKAGQGFSFTITSILNNLFFLNQIEEIVTNEISKNPNIILLGKNDKQQVLATIDTLLKNQRRTYNSLIRQVINQYEFRVDYYNSNKELITKEKFESYLDFRNKIRSENHNKNKEIKERRNEFFNNIKRGDISAELPKIMSNTKINDIVDKEIFTEFGFKYAYELFTVNQPIKVKDKGTVYEVRKRFFDRLIKNAQSSENQVEKTDSINMNEIAYYRLVKSGKYVEFVSSIFSKLLNIEVGEEIATNDEITQNTIDKVLEQEAKWENMTEENWEQELKWQKEQDEQIRLDFEIYFDNLNYVNEMKL